ncbi:uncharacterized protein LOC112127319 [Cimex lectularius]|uniref:Uncharacterized protein n=1 Tax=Cimex lectularius TaxID=79782 RepID=A0A8I6SMJ3_CIMLE|nr:uncharacterized protein LOC112127319 [Cimex lectularius]
MVPHLNYLTRPEAIIFGMDLYLLCFLMSLGLVHPQEWTGDHAEGAALESTPLGNLFSTSSSDPSRANISRLIVNLNSAHLKLSTPLIKNLIDYSIASALNNSSFRLEDFHINTENDGENFDDGKPRLEIVFNLTDGMPAKIDKESDEFLLVSVLVAQVQVNKTKSANRTDSIQGSKKDAETAQFLSATSQEGPNNKDIQERYDGPSYDTRINVSSNTEEKKESAVSSNWDKQSSALKCEDCQVKHGEGIAYKKQKDRVSFPPGGLQSQRVNLNEPSSQVPVIDPIGLLNKQSPFPTQYSDSWVFPNGGVSKQEGLAIFFRPDCPVFVPQFIFPYLQPFYQNYRLFTRA